MGRNAKSKAQRRTDRLTQKLSGEAPTGLKMGFLSKEDRRILQKQRDIALAQAKAKYHATVAAIHQEHGQRVHALLAKTV